MTDTAGRARTMTGQKVVRVYGSALMDDVRGIEEEAASDEKLRAAAIEVLRATDAYRDAVNGVKHEGPHDRMLHFDPCTDLPGVEHVYSPSTDCAACGGAQYGTEDELHLAIGDLREAVGQDRRPWETR